MPPRIRAFYLLTIVLGIAVLGAQLHCCVDLTSGVMSSHVCPICSTAGSAVAPPSLILAMVPAVDRLEVVGMTAKLPVVVWRNVSPRAPPAS
jgi:hypothetical protein